MPSIGVVVNFYREDFALPSFFAPAEAMFDELVFVHSPPAGAAPDPSVDIVEASGHRLIHDTVEKGFGILRTRCIGYSKCDWVVIMDADERIYSKVPSMTPIGTEKYPETPDPAVTVTKHETDIDQHLKLRNLVDIADKEGSLAVCLSRRHWFDAPGGMTRPCQNWHHIPDWQLRCVKNTPYICFDPEWKMHEKLVDCRTWKEPAFLRASERIGPFIDHYHIWAKKQEPENNIEDMKTYQRLDKKNTEGMWLEQAAGVKA